MKVPNSLHHLDGRRNFVSTLVHEDHCVLYFQHSCSSAYLEMAQDLLDDQGVALFVIAQVEVMHRLADRLHPSVDLENELRAAVDAHWSMWFDTDFQARMAMGVLTQIRYNTYMGPELSGHQINVHFLTTFLQDEEKFRFVCHLSHFLKHFVVEELIGSRMSLLLAMTPRSTN